MERLQPNQGEDQEMLEWPCSEAVAEIAEKRRKLEKLIADMTEAELAITEVESQLAKLPKPCPNQQLKDRAALTNTELQVTENYTKQKMQLTTRLEELAEEEKQRNERLALELKKADDDHQARLKAVRAEHELHMADICAKTEAAKQTMQHLEAECQERCKQLDSLIAATQPEGAP